eukprot:CAMPEP_0171070366 /NCGR_PEP_ID=MMETSP0766_2-20121228/9698_1 /TAXON_ID=439317 /ORGANISM="Gambierdiscus australes, Strain CAWD 149" /LENGTH=698 /DNA_ID=CAMNT_0011526833 /DNA_START=14 /DNA_END=2110 /DNA_ORIENTATION=+
MAELKPYRVEAALSARSVCTASKTKIDKGELRFGSLVNFGGKGTYKWRKLACITAKQVSNVEKEVGGLASLDGFADLSIEQRAAVTAAFETASSAMKVKEAPEPKKKAKADSDGAPQPKKKAKVDSDVAAHMAIDLAKAGDWLGVYAALDVQPALVNARPEVREYAVLHQAAFHGDLAAVTTLLDAYSADTALRTRSGQSALDVAEERGHVHIVECLALRLAAKAKAKAQDLQSTTTTAGAAQPGQQSSPAKAKCTPTGLLLTPEKPAKCTKFGEPLASVHTAHRAIDLAKGAQWEDLFTLLDLRREVVNLRPDVREYGVLHQAAFYGSLDVVKALVTKYGADPGLRTRHGETAEDVALKGGHHGIAAALRACPAVVMEGPEPEVPTEEDAEDVDLVQMPDGSWKVATTMLQPSPTSASSSSAPPASDSAPPASSTGSTGESLSSTSTSGNTVGAISSCVAAWGPAVDPGFTEAAAFHVHCDVNEVWACELSRGGQGCVLQLLERKGRGSYCVFTRTGASQLREQRFPSLAEAVAAFKAAFLERTANRWEDRTRFKPFFGKFAYSKPAAAPPKAAAAVAAAAAPLKALGAPTPAPALTQDMMAAAHAVIDVAKAGKWAEVYRLLDARPELVNVRPDVREFAALHQAAYLGNTAAVSTLIEKYGADPSLKTKLGVSAVVVASGRGHTSIADFIAALLPA